MKKLIVKHWVVSYWVIVLVVLTIITSLLLCGAARACKKPNCKPNAVRDWNGDTSFVDWPCGQTDTVVTEPPMDTLHSSWAWNYSTDTVVFVALVHEPDTVLDGWCDNSVHNHEFIGGGELLDSIAKGKWWCGIGWTQHPERWYVKSVDTIRCDTLWLPLKIDTTWTKKVSLGNVWITPYERWKLRQLLKGFWVNGRWATPEEVDKHLRRFDDK